MDEDEDHVNKPTPRTRRRAFVDAREPRRSDPGQKDELNRQLLQERQEDEVKMADLEGRLRMMILETVKPTVARATKLQVEHEDIRTSLAAYAEKLQKVFDQMNTVKEVTDQVHNFHAQMAAFEERSHSLEVKLAGFNKSLTHRIEVAEHAHELQKSATGKLGRHLDRVAQDMDNFCQDVSKLKDVVDIGTQRNREHVDAEIKRVDICIAEFKEVYQSFVAEVWGPEDPLEISPPSLRRLDMQAKSQGLQLRDALSDLAELRRLDFQMFEVQGKQTKFDKDLAAVQDDCKGLHERAEAIAEEAKADSKHVSNMMAAFTANLLQEVRGSFSSEVKELKMMQQDVEQFMTETTSSVKELDRLVQSTVKLMEAELREVRFDLQSCDSKRKQDKDGVETGIESLRSRVGAALDASDATLKGLEHISSVISMSLQSERMAVALDVQDFLERKDTPYVGVRGVQDRGRCRGNGKIKNGLEAELLFRICYQPQKVAFQGNNFERPELLGLREKLVSVAQEVLMQGPKKSINARKLLGGTPVDTQSPGPPMVPSALGASCDVPLTGRRSVPPGGRPGSRGQPGARGSPGPEDVGSLTDRFHYSRAGSAEEPSPAGAEGFRSGGLSPTADAWGPLPPSANAAANTLASSVVDSRHHASSPAPPEIVKSGTHLPALAAAGADLASLGSARAAPAGHNMFSKRNGAAKMGQAGHGAHEKDVLGDTRHVV